MTTLTLIFISVTFGFSLFCQEKEEVVVPSVPKVEDDQKVEQPESTMETAASVGAMHTDTNSSATLSEEAVPSNAVE